jgi:hypothetical protein
LVLIFEKSVLQIKKGNGKYILVRIRGCHHWGLLAKVLGSDTKNIHAVWTNLR